MPEYDAFGREVDEDPLADLGWRSSAAEQPARRGASGRRRRPRRPGAALALVLLIGGGAAATTFISATDRIDDDLGRALSDTSTFPTIPPPPTTPSTSVPPKGLQPGSLLRRDAFSRVLSALQARGTRVITLRLTADDATAVVTGGSRARIVSIDWRGGVTELPATDDLARLPETSLSELQAVGPTRAVTRAAGRLGRPATSVSSLLLLRSGDRALWTVAFADGRTVRTTLGGRLVD